MQILQEKPYGPEVDWWSFGVTLHKMMVGELPAKVLGHPDQYPSCLSGKAVSILMMVSIVNIKTEALEVHCSLFNAVFFHIYRHWLYCY
jgi:Protein kinase domain.